MTAPSGDAPRDFIGHTEPVNQAEDETETEVVIMSERGSPVLMSKDEYDALAETSYLLRSPKNAARLMAALAAAQASAVTEPARLDPREDVTGTEPIARKGR